jgi:hypothetical protein
MRGNGEKEKRKDMGDLESVEETYMKVNLVMDIRMVRELNTLKMGINIRVLT